MKKNILITLLTITTVSFFTYSFIKANEAVKSANEALSAQKEAVELKAEINLLKEYAEQAAAEAYAQVKLAEQTRQDCQNK